MLTRRLDGNPALTLYSAATSPPFRTLKIRGKKATCLACGTTNGAEKLLSEHVDRESVGQWAIAECGIGEGVPAGQERISSIVRHGHLWLIQQLKLVAGPFADVRAVSPD